MLRGFWLSAGFAMALAGCTAPYDRDQPAGNVASEAVDLFWAVCLNPRNGERLEQRLDRLGWQYARGERDSGFYAAWSVYRTQSEASFRLVSTDVLPCIVDLERPQMERVVLTAALEATLRRANVRFRKERDDAEGAEYLAKLPIFQPLPAIRILATSKGFAFVPEPKDF